MSNTNNTTEPTMVKLITAFVNSFEFEYFEKIDEDGCKMTGTKQRKRDLKMLSDAVWKSQEYLIKMLGPVVGTNCRVTEKGVEIRDLYLTKVFSSENINPKTGKPYKWLKIGTLFSGKKFDTETEEEKIWVRVQIGVIEWKPAEKGPEKRQAASSEETAQAEAIETLESM